eukprot:177274-Prymnesium_polylepis.1
MRAWGCLRRWRERMGAAVWNELYGSARDMSGSFAEMKLAQARVSPAKLCVEKCARNFCVEKCANVRDWGGR